MNTISDSRGKLVSFSISTGLQAQNSGVLHSLNEVIDIIEAHLKDCAEKGTLFVAGTVTQAAYVRAWGRVGMIKGPGACVEQVVVFAGDLDPLHTDGDVNLLHVEDFLNTTAELLVRRLGQFRARVKLGGTVWTVGV